MSLCLVSGCASSPAVSSLAQLERHVLSADAPSLDCKVMLHELDGFPESAVRVEEERSGSPPHDAELTWVYAEDDDIQLRYLVVRSRRPSGDELVRCPRVYRGHDIVITGDGMIVTTYRRSRDETCVAVEPLEHGRGTRRVTCEQRE